MDCSLKKNNAQNKRNATQMCGGALELSPPPFGPAFSPSNEQRVLLHVEHISAAWRRCETQRDKDQRLKRAVWED